MLFAHDTEVSLTAAVRLVNSASDPDTLVTIADLDDFYTEFEYTGRRDGDMSELEEVRQLRHELREMLTGERDDAAEIVNRMLAQAGAVPRLVRHNCWDWHVHAVDPEAALPTRMAVETAMAMIELIRADEMSRLGVCAGQACDGVVLDLSRNRSRKFCSTACGNRVAVAHYRARRGS
ncbi:MAG: CGNR zinc finger domain-containing protein [Nocardioides sp.]|nr:CGNR zinc finger domain-containing protein [Nocardioides sp.]